MGGICSSCCGETTTATGNEDDERSILIPRADSMTPINGPSGSRRQSNIAESYRQSDNANAMMDRIIDNLTNQVVDIAGGDDLGRLDSQEFHEKSEQYANTIGQKQISIDTSLPYCTEHPESVLSAQLWSSSELVQHQEVCKISTENYRKLKLPKPENLVIHLRLQ